MRWPGGLERIARLWDAIGQPPKAVTPSASASTPATRTRAVRTWSVWSIESRRSPAASIWYTPTIPAIAFDSGADRHANFGEGEVGTDALAEVVRTAAVPVVVETPGGREGQGSDIAWLKENV